MRRGEILTILGIIGVIVAFCVGLSMSSSNEYKPMLMLLGIMLGVIIIGLGQILYHLQNKEEDRDTEEQNKEEDRDTEEQNKEEDKDVAD